MSVAVSLEALVATPGTIALWPEKFRELAAKLEEQPDEPTAWLVLADWLQEHDESEMESACRWVAKRIPAGVTVRDFGGRWGFDGLPAALKAGHARPGDVTTLAVAVAVFAAIMRRTREALA